MSQPVLLFLLSLVSLVGLGAGFILLWLLFPTRLTLIHERIQAAPGHAFLLGLVNALFLTALGMAAGSLLGDAGGILATLLLAAGAIGAALGLAALTRLLGERLLPERESPRQIAAGTLLAGLACLTPFAGWFLLLPYLLTLALGGFILALRR